MRAGRFGETEQVLRTILTERPEIVRIQLDYALVLYRLGRDDEARNIFLSVRRMPGVPAAVRALPVSPLIQVKYT